MGGWSKKSSTREGPKMRDIKLLNLSKYDDEGKFEPSGNGIYRELADADATCYRVALSFMLEDGEGQYPLEDLLDKYYLYVSDFLGVPPGTGKPGDTVSLELAGELGDIRKAAALVGKRVYNKEYTGDNGNEYMKLVIE
jgi:hypothetical protein